MEQWLEQMLEVLKMCLLTAGNTMLVPKIVFHILPVYDLIKKLTVFSKARLLGSKSWLCHLTAK